MSDRPSHASKTAPLIGLIGVAVALGATPAAAADSSAGPAPSDVQLGQFVIRPGSAPESKAFPAGSALVRCHLTATAVPTGCVVLDETPKGSGLGALALKLAPTFQLRPPPGVDPTGVMVRIPLLFAP